MASNRDTRGIRSTPGKLRHMARQKPPAGFVYVNLTLPDDLVRRAKARAALGDTSMSALVADLLRRELEDTDR